MSAPALDRMDLEMDLRSAITNRDSPPLPAELRLERDASWSRALIRWQHGSAPAPARRLHRLPRRRANRALRAWGTICRRAGQIEFPRQPALGMSVKLRPSVPESQARGEITDALTMAARPGLLKLEITESV